MLLRFTLGQVFSCKMYGRVVKAKVVEVDDKGFAAKAYVDVSGCVG